MWRQFYILSHWDRNHRSNFLCPVRDLNPGSWALQAGTLSARPMRYWCEGTGLLTDCGGCAAWTRVAMDRTLKEKTLCCFRFRYQQGVSDDHLQRLPFWGGWSQQAASRGWGKCAAGGGAFKWLYPEFSTHTHAFTCACARKCPCMDTHACTPVCLQAYTHMCMCTYIYRHTRAHTQTHTCAQACAHMHTHDLMFCDLATFHLICLSIVLFFNFFY